MASFYRHADGAYQEAVQGQQRAIMDLCDGATYAASLPGWCPVREEGEGS